MKGKTKDDGTGKVTLKPLSKEVSGSFKLNITVADVSNGQLTPGCLTAVKGKLLGQKPKGDF